MKKNLFFLSLLLTGSLFSQLKIVGGNDVDISLRPFQISLQQTYDSSHMCGGSIIDDEWILTAAHCVQDIDPSEIQIMAGVTKLSELKLAQIIKVSAIFTHHYDGTEVSNDIALLKLNQKLTMNANVKIIPIVSQADEQNGVITAGTNSSVSGWGLIEENAQDPSDILQIVDVPLVSNQTAMVNYPELQNFNLAAGGVQNGKDACQGDSGGPLTVQDNTTTKLAGIVSYGNGCGTDYGIYTKVSYYEDWINNIMQGNPFAKFSIDNKQITNTNILATNESYNEPDSYIWKLFSKGSTQILKTGTVMDYNFTVTSPGDYTLRLIATKNNIADSTEKDFTVYEKPTFCGTMNSFEGKTLSEIKDNNISVFSFSSTEYAGIGFNNTNDDLLIVDTIYFDITSMDGIPAQDTYGSMFIFDIDGQLNTDILYYEQPKIGLNKAVLSKPIYVFKGQSLTLLLRMRAEHPILDKSYEFILSGYYLNSYDDFYPYYSADGYSFQVFGSVNGKKIMPAFSFSACSSEYRWADIGKNEAENAITVFPNPANDIITFNFTGTTAHIDIMDATGNVVLSNEIKTMENISIASLAAGLYFVRINDSNTTHTVKLIKK